MSPATLQDNPTVETFFNVVETETLALFEHLSFEFLEEFDVFAPAQTGRTREHEPPEMMRGFLHCYYKDIYGIRPVARELNNTVVWLGCGFDRPPSRDAVDRFLTDLEHVVDKIFDHLVEQVALRGLLDSTYSIDSTDVRTMPADQDASKCYDSTAEEYYYGYGCTIVSTGSKIPIAAEFTESKQAPEETAMRVTCDALAVETPIWMLGDSAYDTLSHLLSWTLISRQRKPMTAILGCRSFGATPKTCTLLADKMYSWSDLRKACREAATRPVIKHCEQNALKKAHNARIDDEVYNQRSMSETVFAMVKDDGDEIRPRSWHGQFRELTRKCS